MGEGSWNYKSVNFLILKKILEKNDTLAHLVLVHLTLLYFRYSDFYKLEVCGNPATSLSVSVFQQHLFPCVSVSYFGNSCKYFTLFHDHYNCYGDLCPVIIDITIAKRLQLAEGLDDG